MANRTKVTSKKRQEFLDELSKDGNVSRSCRYLGIARKTIYEHRNRLPKFAEQWKEAEEKGIDRLLDECRRRAIRGVSEPVFHKGVVVGFKKNYSDTLAMFLVKAHRPEYRDRPIFDIPADSKFQLNVEIPNPDKPSKED